MKKSRKKPKHSELKVLEVGAFLLMFLFGAFLFNSAKVSALEQEGNNGYKEIKLQRENFLAKTKGTKTKKNNTKKTDSKNNQKNNAKIESSAETNKTSNQNNVTYKEHRISPNSRYYNYVWKDASGNVPEFKVYIFEPKNFNGRTVFVDAGHGDNSSPLVSQKREKVYPVEDSKLANMNTSRVGSNAYDIGVEARGFKNIYNNNETEPEFTIKVADVVKNKLLAKGYRVVMSRLDNNSNISNGARSILAGETSDIMVSIHSNASVNHGSFGTLAFYPGDNDYMSGETHTGYTKIFGLDKNQESSKRLANIISGKVATAAGLRNLGEHSAVLRIFTYSSIPTCLVEVGFSDNSNDAKALVEKKESISQGIVDGIEEYYK